MLEYYPDIKDQNKNDYYRDNQLLHDKLSRIYLVKTWETHHTIRDRPHQTIASV